MILLYPGDSSQTFLLTFKHSATSWDLFKQKDYGKTFVIAYIVNYKNCENFVPHKIFHVQYFILIVLTLYSIHDGITVKEEMQRIIAEVRGFKPVRLSTRQLGTLAQHFKKRVMFTVWLLQSDLSLYSQAEDILEYDDSENVRRLVEVR